MGKLIDITGQKFGRLTVKSLCKSGNNVKTTWICDCDCGNKNIEVRGDRLKSGQTKSCGCYNNEMRKITGKLRKKYNKYDLLNNDFGIGYSSNTNEPFYFDLEDYDKIKNYCWMIGNNKYVRSTDKNGNGVLLHRIIMDVEHDMQVDHINHNTLDNRKNNLRICSNLENSRNKDLSMYNKIGITGVSWLVARKQYVSSITVNYKKIHLGYFNNLDEAISKRKEAEKIYFGEYSYDESMKKAKELGIPIISEHDFIKLIS